jgi:hypothetical protein
MQNQLSVEVKDSVFDPDLPEGHPERKVHVRQSEDSRPFYKVWIYLQGKDLPYVLRTTYRLHETFEDPIRVVERNPTNPNCKLVIWTWGLFDVGVAIADKSGRVYETVYRMRYDEQLKELKPELYEYEQGAPTSGSIPEMVRG